jgi:gamma-glutamyltranspeptidase/glutathione hydrolase
VISRKTFMQAGSLRAARFFLAPAILVCTAPAWAQADQPEAASGFTPRPAVIGAGFMAVTANGYATDAAAEILQLGGNALDAAIAAQWVLNLVEPQSAGIGGGGFLLHWDQQRRRVSAWDGRETAPPWRQRRPLAASGRRPGELRTEILATGKAVGVPGLVAMLEAAHQRHGRLAMGAAVPACHSGSPKTASPISPRLHLLLRDDPLLRLDAAARVLYYM